MIRANEILPFNELICSWNGVRPTHSTWVFWVRVDDQEWIRYAEWGPRGQRTFQHQDVIPCSQATRYEIRVEGEELDKLHSIHVYTTPLPCERQDLLPLLLPHFPKRSQMILPHARARDLCSPTSHSLALSYLSGKTIEPIHLAPLVRDEAFDIYGNWILNSAESYNQTGICCRVERLFNFDALYRQLKASLPVVVSVKGTLPNAPKSYPSGHLMCVIGYENQEVICIDPAFPDDASTLIHYPLTDFLSAWAERRNLAYLYGNSTCELTISAKN